MLTKTEICNLLERSDKAIARALIVLNNNQTKTEQLSQATINHNGIGVRPCHARMLTSMAEFYQKRGYLSPKQIAYWRMKDKNGDMRLGIYWRQLAEAAEAKKNTVAKSLQTVTPVSTIVATQTEDVGNAAEAEMVRQEISATTILRAHSDEAEMHRMEADNDRRQTALEEYRKFMWKNSVEGNR